MKRLGCTQERVLKYLKLHREALLTTEVALGLGMSTDRARITLRRLFKSGLVLRRAMGAEIAWYPTPETMLAYTPALHGEIPEA